MTEPAAIRIRLEDLDELLTQLGAPKAPPPPLSDLELPYRAPFYGYRCWHGGDDGALLPPLRSMWGQDGTGKSVVDSTLAPPVTSSRVSATCLDGCGRIPGPCGGCGITMILRPDMFLRFLSRVARAPEEVRGIGLDPSRLVAARVRVAGRLYATPRQKWTATGIPEVRAEAVDIEELFVPDHLGGLVATLADRYRVPVHVGITAENLGTLYGESLHIRAAA